MAKRPKMTDEQIALAKAGALKRARAGLHSDVMEHARMKAAPPRYSQAEKDKAEAAREQSLPTGGMAKNTDKTSSRFGEQYKATLNDRGQVVHTYAAKAGGLPQESVVLGKYKASWTPAQKASNAQAKADPDAMAKLAKQMMNSKKPRRG